MIFLRSAELSFLAVPHHLVHFILWIPSFYRFRSVVHRSLPVFWIRRCIGRSYLPAVLRRVPCAGYVVKVLQLLPLRVQMHRKGISYSEGGEEGGGMLEVGTGWEVIRW